ncbi:MAG: hypothetical protein QM770_24950 [Tepidisphaeraceae bacterium]
MNFAWDDWNTGHIARHGVNPIDAERVVRGAKRPYPKRLDSEKYIVAGRTSGGHLLQVVYVLRPIADFKIDELDMHVVGAPDENRLVYVIHAMFQTREQRHRRRGEE